MSEESYKVDYMPFVVDETPYCIWADHLKQTNLEYLQSIDPYYFQHIAQTFLSLLEGNDRQYAATALRAHYSQALETFFALLGALVQAPHCPVGWMMRYKNGELFSLIRKIHTGQTVMTKFNCGQITWEILAAIVFNNTSNESERDALRVPAFARFWRRLAEEFIQEEFSEEYNSIKHGLRVRMGGFGMALGLEKQFGVPVPKVEMRSMGSSEFGSSFHGIMKLQNSHNFCLEEHKQNWHPMRFAKALPLLAMSIFNVLGALEELNGLPPDQLQFLEPEDYSQFDEPDKYTVDLLSSRWNPGYDPKDIAGLSKQEILDSYKPKV